MSKNITRIRSPNMPNWSKGKSELLTRKADVREEDWLSKDTGHEAKDTRLVRDPEARGRGEPQDSLRSHHSLG